MESKKLSRILLVYFFVLISALLISIRFNSDYAYIFAIICILCGVSAIFTRVCIAVYMNINPKKIVPSLISYGAIFLLIAWLIFRKNAYFTNSVSNIDIIIVALLVILIFNNMVEELNIFGIGFKPKVKEVIQAQGLETVRSKVIVMMCLLPYFEDLKASRKYVKAPRASNAPDRTVAQIEAQRMELTVLYNNFSKLKKSWEDNKDRGSVGLEIVDIAEKILEFWREFFASHDYVSVKNDIASFIKTMSNDLRITENDLNELKAENNKITKSSNR